MDKSLIKNYIFNIAYQLVKIVMPLITVPFLYSMIGADTLGISDFASNIAGWFILFGVLGVNTYGSREIAKVRDNKENLTKSFWEIFVMQLLNMTVATILYFVYIRFTVKENLIIYYLTLFTLLASALDITWFFYGVEDFKKASIRNIVVKLLGVSLIFIFIRKPEDLWLYVIFNSCSELFGQAIMFVQLKQYIGYQNVNIKEAYTNHFKATFTLFIPTVAISIYTILDQTMIGYLYGTTHLNYYKTSMAIVKMFMYFITSIGSIMLPRVTNVYYNQEGGKEKAAEYVSLTMKIAMFLAIPLCFGMMSVAKEFISWYLPTTPIIGDLIVIGCPVIIFISMSNVTGIQYMVPTGMHKEFSASVIVGSIINFIINLIVIRKYGAYGAIVASVIAEGTVTLVQYILIKRRANICFKSMSYIKYLIAAGLMYVVVVLITPQLSFITSGFVRNIIEAICGAMVYFVVLAVTKEELLYKVIGKVIKRNA